MNISTKHPNEYHSELTSHLQDAETSKNSSEKGQESKMLGKILEKINGVWNRIIGCLCDAAKIIPNQEMWYEIDKMYEQRKKGWNKDIMNVLWGFDKLFEEFWKNWYENIANEYRGCLLELRNFYNKYDTTIPEIIANLDNQIWAGIEDTFAKFKGIIDLGTNLASTETTNSKQSTPQKPYTWLTFTPC